MVAMEGAREGKTIPPPGAMVWLMLAARASATVIPKNTQKQRLKQVCKISGTHRTNVIFCTKTEVTES